MSECPTHRPPNYPAQLKGVATVNGSTENSIYTVNFDTGECDCQNGDPWRWDNRRWVPASFCNHKMRALASLVNAKPKDAELREFYDTQLGKRYNAFVAVSAMHKELRRGEVEAALYWATVMIPHRGRHGVINYLRNIIFEETRDLPLARYVLKLSTKGKSVTMLEMQRAVARFCVAPKKWELPWRYDIFMDEMKGYRKLAKQYGYEVAKGKDIITEGAHDFLYGEFLAGFANADRVQLQVGIKGWFKSKSPDHDDMKLQIFNTLTDVLNGEHPNKFEHNEDYCHKLHSFLLARLRVCGTLGYHELNALADALSGENGDDPRASLTANAHKRHTAFPKVRRVKLGVMRRVPLYANDNHTWHGKSLMKAYGTQLEPGATQDKLDFRLCGAYMGVAWRTLAYKQHATIDCKWGDVSWKRPSWLWSHLDDMWYIIPLGVATKWLMSFTSLANIVGVT